MRMYFIFAAVFTLLLFAGPSLAAGLEKFHFIKFSSPEQKAVIKIPDGGLVMVGVGDVVGEDARIIEITEGQVILERPGEFGTETLIIRLDEEGRQKVDRMQVVPLSKSRLPADGGLRK